jgi:hypothetical protein
MKKLERMDGKLFESLKPNEMSNLAAFVGGDIKVTSGTQDFQVGNKIYTKKFTDKQKGGYTKEGVWYDDGCPYDHIYFRPIGNVDPGLNTSEISLIADLKVSE